MQGVRVQVSAHERLLRPETRNLKPETLGERYPFLVLDQSPIDSFAAFR
jgi:hypothetical protein